MYTYLKLITGGALSLALVCVVSAQRPRTTTTDDPAPQKPAPAPMSFKAKYEGGIFGYSQKKEGTLRFDDENNRLEFRDKKGEMTLHIPYNSIQQEFADNVANRPKSASILGSVPIPYGINPIGFIKTKNAYVTIQFFDGDSRSGGVTSFRVDNKELCASVVTTLADKAGLVAKGPVYTRTPAPTGPVVVGRSGGAVMTGAAEVPAPPAVLVENEMLSSRVISLPRPVYPEEARQQKVGGVVRVLATVDESGSVAEAEAVSGSPMLQEAAVNAAKQAKFEPLGRGGRPAKTKTIIAYNFQLL
jgi:TonB family protein